MGLKSSESAARVRLAGYALFTRRSADALWLRLKRWFIVAVFIGLLVGLATTALHWVVYTLLWNRVNASLTPLTIVLFPTFGLLLSGLLLQFGTKDQDIHGTEEVIQAFHRKGAIDHRSAPVKVLAAIATLGFGGAAGLEGPSIYMGAVAGSWIVRRMRRWGFTAEDVRTLMLAGAAAGVAAIFKAPLTGIIFALEVPYKDDIAREALIPALVASVSSYLVLVSILGVEPLFSVAGRYSLSSARDLGIALGLGLLVGIIARLFVSSFKRVRTLALGSGLPLYVRTTIGGFVVGLLGLIGLNIFHSSIVLGTGYDAVSGLMSGSIEGFSALWLLILKTLAVLATLGSGAAGGMFIPLIVLGASSGAVLGGLIPGGGGPLFPVVGMAAFLAAGYNTPIAAAVFIAETTGGSGYLIPGLVGAAVAYTVASRHSVSGLQRWRRETRLERAMHLSICDIMKAEVITVPAETTVEAFVRSYIVAMRHKGFPVVRDGKLVGMAGLTDVNTVPRDRWADTPLSEVMVTPVTTTPRALVGDVVAVMNLHGFDRIPVVEARDPQRLVGIVSSTDVLGIEELRMDSSAVGPEPC